MKKPTYTFNEVLNLLVEIDNLDGFLYLFEIVNSDMQLYSDEDAKALKVFLVAKRRLFNT